MAEKKTKKITPKKKNTRKNHKKNKKQTPKIKTLYLFLLIFLFAFLASSSSYFIMKNENPNKSVKNNILENKTIKEKKEDLKNFQEKKLNEYFSINEQEDAFEEYTQEFHKDHIDEEIQNKTKKIKELKKEAKKDKNKENMKVLKESSKTQIQKKVEEKKADNFNKKAKYVYNNKSKPKLAIVIDDVSSSKQKRDILNIGYKITMAFLPPTKQHSNSAKIAQDLPFYMIHFPMQASKAFKGYEEHTLNITDSYEKIEQRVKKLRAWYPNAKYTNNHTGSVFTKDYESMNKLFKALKKYDFTFVDSRTTAKSQGKIMAKKYDMPYIVRNTFLDNNKDFNYIQKQLKKAIKIAKKRGYAIAIGHPYPITLKVLNQSKHLLKDLDLIYVNELPYL